MMFFVRGNVKENMNDNALSVITENKMKLIFERHIEIIV